MKSLDTPDLGQTFDPYALRRRKSFSVGPYTFKQTDAEQGEYRCGNVVVYCDQQDSTAWAARCGDARTVYFWAPEFAVQALLSSTLLLEVG